MAEREGRLLGFCAHGPAPGNSAEPVVAWEIYGLHVEPSLRGTGIGSALFAASREAARRSGARALTLWVVSTNAPARRFYEAKGMQPDGAVKKRDLAPDVVLHEVRYSVPVEHA